LTIKRKQLFRRTLKDLRRFADQRKKIPRLARIAHVSDIAADLNLSSSRFRHLFKQELGLSPKRYLKLTRLNRAKKLLENSFLRVKEITTVLGVNDVSHFVRDYKAFYRQTPSQTRVLYRRVPRRIPVDSRYGQ